MSIEVSARDKQDKPIRQIFPLNFLKALKSGVLILINPDSIAGVFVNAVQ
jgi:hypothetical protein